MKFTKVTHVIFDMDGLLLDTETLYSKAFQNVVQEFDKEYTWELKQKLMGKQEKVVAKIIVDALSLPIAPEEFTVKAQNELNKVFQHVDLMPGAERLLLHLHSHNVPFALATSSTEKNATLKIKNHKKLFNLFSHKIYGSSNPEVKNGKPAPDIFLYAAAKFADNPKPKDCLVFEDSPSGMQAGIAAGMQVVLVPDPRLDASLTEGAAIVIPSLNEFKPELFGLPPFQ